MLNRQPERDYHPIQPEEPRGPIEHDKSPMDRLQELILARQDVCGDAMCLVTGIAAGPSLSDYVHARAIVLTAKYDRINKAVAELMEEM